MKAIFVVVRVSPNKTETREKGEEFLDFASFGETPEQSLSKSRSKARLLSTRDFDIETLYPIDRVTRVAVEEI